MENINLIENLGNLASKCELEAARADMPEYGRVHLMDLADRYREAQYIEIRHREAQ